jgi:hypothetical protein
MIYNKHNCFQNAILAIFSTAIHILRELLLTLAENSHQHSVCTLSQSKIQLQARRV